jgi:hypothetical protein
LELLRLWGLLEMDWMIWIRRWTRQFGTRGRMLCFKEMCVCQVDKRCTCDH